MERKFDECLNETYGLFKSQGVSIIGSGYTEVMSNPALFESYVESLTSDASADTAAAVSQIMANTNASMLSESSVTGIAPIASLSGPIIRKLWPSFCMKNAVKTEVAKTPAFAVNYMKPYYEDETGKHYILSRDGSDFIGEGGVDSLGGNSLNNSYANVYFAITNGVGVETVDEVKGLGKTLAEWLTVSTSGSLIKRQPIDADLELVQYYTGTGEDIVSHRVGKKLGVENVIVADVADGTIIVRANLDARGSDSNLTVLAVGTEITGVTVRVHRSSEFNEVNKSWGLDIGREDIRIGTGEHFNSPLPVEALQDMGALYQIDGTKEAVDLMTNAMAYEVDSKIINFLRESFINQPGQVFGGAYSEYPTASKYLAVFNVKPAAGFAGGPKAWREELKPVIDHLAARIKNQTHLGAGMFVIVGNPLDVQLITNVDWTFRGGQQTVDGVSVNYSLGTYYGSAYAYRIVSSEIVKQGTLFIDFLPETNNQRTYQYWAYTFNTELGYRDPNHTMVPSVMLSKRDALKSFMPAIAAVKIIGNDAGTGYDPFRDYIPTSTTAEGVNDNASGKETI
jgi:hypothetical protein